MISIIIPFHNEEESLPVLFEKITDVMKKEKIEYEIIFVNDGSTDNSVSALKKMSGPYTLISHRRRLGKGQSLSDAFEKSHGEIILFMDADLQDDPADIPHFMAKIKEGFDFVNGWRKDRKDRPTKRFVSAIFNTFLLNLFFHSKFHDINCGFKAMRKEVLEEIMLYGDNYRFLPLLANESGFRSTEVVVSHNPRRFGHSKYGTLRLISGLFDTFTNYFIFRFSEKPLHFFGLVGGGFLAVGTITMSVMLYQRAFMGVLLYRRPLFLITILVIIVGLQIMMTGVIAELIVYLHKKRNK